MKQKPEVADVVVAPLGSLAGRSLADFTRIYEAVFPADDRETTEKVVGGINGRRMRCIAARRDGRLLGFAVLLPLTGRARGIHYLVYLGVDPELQSAGLGGRLLRGCADAGAALGVVLEIEDPTIVGAPNTEQRWKRVAFYERNGAAFVQGAPDYRAPNFSRANGTLPFKLMWLPTGVRELRGDLLRACVEAIMVEGYRLEPGDPLVRSNLARLVPPRA
jgi:GNAT superfamily N-acetyltransferase